MMKQSKDHESQIARAKETLKLSHGGPGKRQASDINQPIKTLRQCRHLAKGLIHRRAMKKKAYL